LHDREPKPEEESAAQETEERQPEASQVKSEHDESERKAA
jgi:hypothetical protein